MRMKLSIPHLSPRMSVLRRMGPGDYEKWKEFQAKFRKMQEEMENLPPLFVRSSHTSDEDFDSDLEGDASSQKQSPLADPDKEGETDRRNISVLMLLVSLPDMEEGASKDDDEEPMPHGEQQVMDILGIDNKNDNDKIVTIDSSLVKIWHKLVNQGLNKEAKEELKKKYIRLPEFEPKKLNPEIAALLSARHMKKDSYMLELQKIAGSSMMAMGTILTLLINDEDCDKLQIVSLLNDIAKMVIQMHHDISVSRRSNIFIPNLAPQVAEIIKKAEIDDTLFGNNLVERIKESKALTKLSEDFQQKPKPATTVNPAVETPFLSAANGLQSERFQSKELQQPNGVQSGKSVQQAKFPIQTAVLQFTEQEPERREHLLKEVVSVRLAGRLKYFVREWQEIRANIFVIDVIRNYKIPVVKEPFQFSPPSFMKTAHFKLKDFGSATNLIFPDCFMCTVDLQDDLSWWSKSIQNSVRTIRSTIFDLTIFTEASNSGRGATDGLLSRHFQVSLVTHRYFFVLTISLHYLMSIRWVELDLASIIKGCDISWERRVLHGNIFERDEI
ncbi:hypothetical protein TSAR_012598 [Trichomalopsis sarcophagae]|uniref:Uncharacterized protein n=1 Tax=Trichomalopsis sarcophagae TaxID=543379 RepID=A0A232EJM4_9HYME|nr:hypothetical protein TSAR_012598 [Trichomalopsis sarcophagae]